MRGLGSFLLIAVFTAYPSCARTTSTAITNTNASPVAVNSPDATPTSSSGVVAVAEIIFEQPNPPFTIDTLMTVLQKRLPYACARTQWVGFTTVIPQIRIDAPTPMILQIDDDPEYVPDEIKELAAAAVKAFGPKIAAKIARCRVRLEVMSVEPSQAVVKDKTINVVATTQLDPSVAPVKDVLKTTADTVHGYVFDNVRGKWQYAAP